MITSLIKNNHAQGKQIYLFLFLVITLVVFILLSSFVGDVKINIGHLLPNFLHNYIENKILFEYRLPRLLIGACAGAQFAISGAVLQAVSKNQLAAPNIIGINSGASFFSVLSLLIFSNSNFFLLPFAAFSGALFASVLVYLFAFKNGISPLRLILSGIAVDALFQAGTTFILVNNTNEVGSIYMWLSGSLWGKEWNEFYFLLPCTLIGSFIAVLLSQRINILTLSDEVIIALGVNINLTRIILLLLAVFLSSSAVCLVGPIGFVGLIVPHIMRALLDYDYKIIIPFSALGGAYLVILSDTIGRTVFAPHEVPAGLIATIIGSPYFIYLLLKERY